jgi:tryptophan 7-halogenase
MAFRRLVIVGGGSAGWVAAAYLNGALNRLRKGPRVEITVVESPDVPRISVGEATIPSLNHVLEVAGIDETDFVRHTDATYKQAIKYRDWSRNDGSYYYHPFTRGPFGPIDFTGDHWARSDKSIPYMETVSAQPALCELGLVPKTHGPWSFGPPLYYAYHMNAQKFADYLTKRATADGVRHVRANMTGAVMRDNGLIAAIETDSAGRIEGDVFVDCTGFSAQLMSKQMGVGYYDASQFLICDRALVMPIPYDVAYPGELRSYTTATALSAGWIWDIPLRTRRAVGYVHSSAFVSADDAEREVRAYEGAHSEKLDTRMVDFHVGWRRRHWEGNCIAIGLSGGFIEPLESTGIYLSELGAVMLAEHFPYKEEHIPALAFRYNRILQNRYHEILDFINLHYCLTQRDDTAFWREVQKPERITDRIKAKLEFWRAKHPSSADLEDQFFLGQAQGLSPAGEGPEDRRPPVDTAKLWSHYSYECIMYGMNFSGRDWAEDDGENGFPSEIQPRVKARIAQLSRHLPRHEDYLRQTVGFEAPPAGPRPDGWS